MRPAFFTPIITGILIGVVFLLIFVPALHKPAPRNVPVGVVGASTAELAQRLPGLELRALDDVATAERQIRDGDIFAAYVPGELLVSSARGSIATNTIKGMVTRAAGGDLRVRDLVPAAEADPNGVSIFYLIFGVTLGAFLFGQGSFAVARHLPVRVKLAQTGVFAVALGVAAALIARVWIGLLPGSVLAETGVLILLAAAVGSFTVAVTSLLKDAGVAVATVVALILGTATSGGALPAEFVPAGFSLFSGVLPSGAAVAALRGLGYYDPADAVVPVLVLLAWIAASVGVVFLAGRRPVAPAVQEVRVLVAD